MAIFRAALGSSLKPTRLRRVLWYIKWTPVFLKEYGSDLVNFMSHSASLGVRNQRHLRAMITESFHNIEKGLSLPSPRVGFGSAVIDRLLTLCAMHTDAYGKNERVLLSARDVLAQYRDFSINNNLHNFPHHLRIDDFITTMKTASNEQFGGLKLTSKAEILEATKGVGPDFFNKRHSVRQFSTEDVDLDLIDQSIELALKAPAVCNRQYSRAVVIADPDLVQHVLKMQGGANGFGHGVNKVIVATTRLSQFWGAGERNQPWIDGGLFAMSLLLALHSFGLGACCLNWSKRNKQTQEMKKFLGLEADEYIIMMIAVGHIPDELSVAYSHRIPSSDSTRVLTHWLRNPKQQFAV